LRRRRRRIRCLRQRAHASLVQFRQRARQERARKLAHHPLWKNKEAMAIIGWPSSVIHGHFLATSLQLRWKAAKTQALDDPMNAFNHSMRDAGTGPKSRVKVTKETKRNCQR
jgi:hypothetical protein